MAKRNYDIEEIKQLIPDYVMGRLIAEEKNIVEEALENSPELRSLLNEISGTVDFVNTVKVKEPEPQYWATLLTKIHDRIEKLEEKRFSWEKAASYWKVLVPAAAVILIAIFYYTYFYKQPDTTITKNKEELIAADTVKKLEKKEDIKKEIVKENEPEKERDKNIKVQKQRE